VLLNQSGRARDADGGHGTGSSALGRAPTGPAVTTTLGRDYADLNQAVSCAGATPATFRYVDLDANLLVAGVWADWILLAGNRHNLEMRCPIVSGAGAGVGAPKLDLSGQWVRIHVRLDKIPALAVPTSGPASLPGAADPLVVQPADPSPPVSVIATSCRAGVWAYQLPRLIEKWFNVRLDELIDVLSVLLADEDEGQISRRH
jgi:hypothetical protein